MNKRLKILSLASAVAVVLSLPPAMTIAVAADCSKDCAPGMAIVCPQFETYCCGVVDGEDAIWCECDAQCEYDKCSAENDAILNECNWNAKTHEEQVKCADEWRERQWNCKPPD